MTKELSAGVTHRNDTRERPSNPESARSGERSQLRVTKLRAVVGVDMYVLNRQVAAPRRRPALAQAQLQPDNDLVLLHALVHVFLIEAQHRAAVEQQHV